MNICRKNALQFHSMIAEAVQTSSQTWPPTPTPSAMIPIFVMIIIAGERESRICSLDISIHDSQNTSFFSHRHYNKCFKSLWILKIIYFIWLCLRNLVHEKYENLVFEGSRNFLSVSWGCNSFTVCIWYGFLQHFIGHGHMVESCHLF